MPATDLIETLRQRSGFGDTEMQRMVGGLRRAAGTRRSSAARSTPSPRSSRSSKSTSRNRSSSCIADATSASGVMPPCCSAIAGSSEPAFTPMRIGSPRSFASLATSLMCSGLRMLPGFRRSACTPASIAASASLYWKWMSATIGTGERGTICARPIAASSSLHVQRTMSAARGGERVDLRERAVDVGGLGGGHRLHRDRRVAADRAPCRPSAGGSMRRACMPAG